MGKKPSHPVVTVFLRGLALILPLAITVFLLSWLWQLVEGHVLERVKSGVIWLGDLVGLDLAPDYWLTLTLSIATVVLAIILIGWWLTGFIGRRIYGAFEKVLVRIPLVSAVYPHAKQITEFFFGQDRKVEFERVVAIPYPRVGLYSLGFLTGSALQSVKKASGRDMVSVFVPSSPMPVTGYTIFLPLDDIIPVNMTVDEALRAVISGGVLVTEREFYEVDTSAAARLERATREAVRSEAAASGEGRDGKGDGDDVDAGEDDGGKS